MLSGPHQNCLSLYIRTLVVWRASKVCACHPKRSWNLTMDQWQLTSKMDMLTRVKHETTNSHICASGDLRAMCVFNAMYIYTIHIIYIYTVYILYISEIHVYFPVGMPHSILMDKKNMGCFSPSLYVAESWMMRKKMLADFPYEFSVFRPRSRKARLEIMGTNG